MGAFIPPGVASGGGGGTPGGSNGQLQYNNAGTFAGVPNTSVDSVTGNTTFSARWINARNSAADEPANTMTGTWFSGGTSTTTKPHFLIEPAGTTSTAWGTSGTGFGVNAASGFAGNLLDLQVNAISQAKISSNGTATFSNVFCNGTISMAESSIAQSNNGITINSRATASNGYILGWSTGLKLGGSGLGVSWTADAPNASPDLTLIRDTAGTLAQRNGLNAQAFRLYNTYTTDTNFERLSFRWFSNEAIITTESGGGGGTLRGLKIGSATTSRLGFWNTSPVTQPAAVPNINTTATTGTLPTPTGNITIANAATPTVQELLAYCVQIESTVETLLTRIRLTGIIAT